MSIVRSKKNSVEYYIAFHSIFPDEHRRILQKKNIRIMAHFTSEAALCILYYLFCSRRHEIRLLSHEKCMVYGLCNAIHFRCIFLYFLDALLSFLVRIYVKLFNVSDSIFILPEGKIRPDEQIANVRVTMHKADKLICFPLQFYFYWIHFGLVEFVLCVSVVY